MDIIALVMAGIIIVVLAWVFRSTSKDEAIEKTIKEIGGLPMTVRDLINNHTGNTPFQVSGVHGNLLFVPLRKINSDRVSIFVVSFEDVEILKDVKPGFYTANIDGDSKAKLTKYET